MTHVNDLHLLVMQDRFSNWSIIVILLNIIFSTNYCLYLTTIFFMLHLFYFMYSQIIFKRRLKNCVDSFSFSLQKYLVHDLNSTCNSNNPNLTIFFFMGLLLAQMMNGRKHGQHGQHASPTIEKSTYFGQKRGYMKTWTTMFEFYHCPMILTLWQVFTMMWLELAKTSLKVWLYIQGVTISSIYGHINYFSLCTLKIIVYIFRIS
jgi:hypothetical protein